VEDGEHAGAQPARGRRLQDRLGDGGEQCVEGLVPALSGEERTADAGTATTAIVWGRGYFRTTVNPRLLNGFQGVKPV
jgi:hypothetical protein